MTLQTADTPAPSSDRVSDLIQKLVAAATAEVEAAAHRTRVQADAEINQLQRTIERLKTDLQAERDKLAAALQELALVRASTSKLKEELEAERTEKGRFAATLETVRLLVTGTDSEHPSPDHTPVPPSDVAEAHDELGDPATGVPPEFAEFQSGDFTALPAQPGAHDDAGGHLVQLLAQIEEIYRSDAESAQGTSEIVRRLAANLAYARDAFSRRMESSDGGDAQVFDRHLDRLLETRAGTPFGRHLAMAVRGSTALEEQAS
jgi:DNA repair exonuclease SbcCD ATPase subunit